MSEATDQAGDARTTTRGGRGAPQQSGGGFDLARATIPEAIDHVGVDVARATEVREAELARGDRARKQLVEHLDALITPPEPDVTRERSYARERLLGPDGPRIARQPAHVLAGALHGVDGDAFTASEITNLCATFLGREAETAAPAEEG